MCSHLVELLSFIEPPLCFIDPWSPVSLCKIIDSELLQVGQSLTLQRSPMIQPVPCLEVLLLNAEYSGVQGVIRYLFFVFEKVDGVEPSLDDSSHTVSPHVGHLLEPGISLLLCLLGVAIPRE